MRFPVLQREHRTRLSWTCEIAHSLGGILADLVKAEFVREIEPGEVLVMRHDDVARGKPLAEFKASCTAVTAMSLNREL